MWGGGRLTRRIEFAEFFVVLVYWGSFSGVSISVRLRSLAGAQNIMDAHGKPCAMAEIDTRFIY